MFKAKVWCGKFLEWFKAFPKFHMKKQITNVENFNETSQNYLFKSLTPTDEVDMSVYEEALDFAFKTSDVKNIALSGSYGSGKSSVLKSYKKNHKKKSFMHISLAHFEESKKSENFENDDIGEIVLSVSEPKEKTKDNKKDPKPISIENVLEGKILNQLLHQISVKNIPQTNFRIKQKVKLWSVIVLTFSIMILLGSFLLIANFNTWKEFVNEVNIKFKIDFLHVFSNIGILAFAIISFLVIAISVTIYFKKHLEFQKLLSKTAIHLSVIIVLGLAIKEITTFAISKGASFVITEEILTSSLLKLLCGSLFAIISFILIFTLIKTQKNKNILQKISVQGNTIEIFEKTDESYFDKYLNEVLYLFENSSVDVIVFEDMDRFNTGKIFERLHEINTLVNIHLSQNKKPELRFLYLLRDDVFVNKDRTKFFDFIIPVVPVIDGSNSYKELNNLIVKSGAVPNFDIVFLKKLSLYIDEMRLLKNIYNEFLVHYSKLIKVDNNKSQSALKLLPEKMLAMVVYKNIFPKDFAALQLGGGYVYTVFSKKEEHIVSKAQSTRVKIESIKTRILNAKKENLESLQEFEDVKNARYQKADLGYYNNGHAQRKEIYDKWVKEDYPARKQAIEDKLANELPNLEAKLTFLENELSDINSTKMCEIAKSQNFDDVFIVDYISKMKISEKFSDIKDSGRSFDLLVFLIREGKIAEDYSDYMTFFDIESIKPSDKNFLLSITDRRDNKQYDYALIEPKKVVEMLAITDFDQPQILNFDLINHLLKVRENNQYQTRFLEQIKNTKNFSFIEKYMNSDKFDSHFVVELNLVWNEVLLESIALSLGKNGDNQEIFSQKSLKEYILHTFYHSSIDILKTQNVNNCLSHYISGKADFLNIENPKINEIIGALRSLEVSFDSISHEVSNAELLHKVYTNHLYHLTFENISMFLNLYYSETNKADISHKNYTLIQLQKESALSKYVNANFSNYLKIVFENCGDEIKDDEKIAISVLNKSSEDVSKEDKEKYIELLSTKITFIKEITDSSLWSLLLNSNTVEYSELNIIDCFVTINLDESIIAYINRCPIDLDFSKIEYESKAKQSFFQDVIICNAIDNAKYKQVLVSLNCYYKDFTISGIHDDKISILIDTGIIRMTSNTLEFMRENYPEQISQFVSKNINEYVNIMNNELFSQNELLEILSSNVCDDLKIKLLEFSNEAISVIDKLYSDKVIVYIINHNLCKEDCKIFFEQYDKYNSIIQAEIQAIAIHCINEIIDERLKTHDILLSVLLQSNNITRAQKISIFTISIPHLNEATCMIHFDELNLSGLKRIFDKSGGRRNYEKNDEVTIILDALKENTWIYEYHEDERNTNKYVVIKNRPRNKEL